MTVRAAFDDEDIRQLLRGPTDDDRATVAHRLCRRIDAGLPEAARQAAGEVLRLIPPLTISDHDFALGMDIVARTIGSVA